MENQKPSFSERIAMMFNGFLTYFGESLIVAIILFVLFFSQYFTKVL